ncbi:unnamed protein product [Pleuronectes platessa]|uniref:Uncharacterized protein n=1 Tax=Pleuronectes platessa TaxID=8262 RepID=A0A9N7TRG5_PLEPL|nr:unnamed protein product [Pleuronectes platessa]
MHNLLRGGCGGGRGGSSSPAGSNPTVGYKPPPPARLPAPACSLAGRYELRPAPRCLFQRPLKYTEKQSEPKWKQTHKQHNKNLQRGTEEPRSGSDRERATVKFAATHRFLTRRKSSVSVRLSRRLNLAPPSRPLTGNGLHVSG